MWFLDSYYLQLERKFRLLYDDVRTSEKNKEYDMNFNNVKIKVKDSYKISYFMILISITEAVFYLTCITTTTLIYLLG